MDKRGLLGGQFVFGLVGFFVLILVAVTLLPVQLDAENDGNKTLEILQGTQDRLLKQFEINESDHVVVRITYSLIGFIMYSTLEVAELGVQYSIDNPDFINAKNLLLIIMISLLAPIILVLFKLIVIIFLLTKEFIQNRKEKKQLAKLKGGK